jgi:transketolase
MRLELGPRRGQHIDIATEKQLQPLAAQELAHYEAFDLLYRSLCALLYNYVPMSGHPGGSISSGRFVTSILFESMDYDCSQPRRDDADIVSYAAGHKALGLYALWALRNEILRLGAPELLPADKSQQLRFEDLLGFRRNPTQATPLFKRFAAKALDGHPTPATPFLRLATGASGVGVATSLGLGFGARDFYGQNAPRLHIVEGEGGLTPGRVAEALAAAGTACLDNVILHLDWNQASIDSNRVCRDGEEPGDYVQWDPMELFRLHDWNVIEVQEGRDFQHVIAAQRRALGLDSTQPTAIVYRTVKGWQYGIEGRASHGAGHKLCSDGFYDALSPLLGESPKVLPSCCDLESARCKGPDGAAIMEECFWNALVVLRTELEKRHDMVQFLAARLVQARQRLDGRARKPRAGAPRLPEVFELAQSRAADIPKELRLEPGKQTTLRAELGRVLNYFNKASQGAFLVSAADLLDSTSVSKVADGFPSGYFNAHGNPEARKLSIGGICEDAMAGISAGLASYGHHVGVASSYAAFIAPLGHVAARLHAIGNQALASVAGEPYRPMILVCAHAGLKTGEDGPTHADPQALQLLQGNFPAHTSITLTPWDPQEMWPLVATALAQRPAIVVPFVTRPNEAVPDREKLNLAPATAARTGVYALRAAQGKSEGTVVLQGSGVTMAFVNDVLPRLDAAGIDLDVFYVASEELFDALPEAERERIFPEARARQAMAITGFTLPTVYRWVTSSWGRACSLHPFRKGHYLGSGQAEGVLREAGLDGDGQYEAIRTYLEQKVRV